MASDIAAQPGAPVLAATLRRALLKIFDETFRQTHGIFLDRGTSLFDTLGEISAEEASRPVSATCATIAAQVEHVRFYLEVMEGYLLGKPLGTVDWGEIWRTVGEVTDDEWDSSRERLKKTHQRLVRLIETSERWESEGDISGSLAIVVHSAYHLGEIRQALCVVKSTAGTQERAVR
jgi:hypothetical protein